jgi:hypothetical protein
MAAAQLVYQIGTNLEQFTDFLNTINKAHVRDPLPVNGNVAHQDMHFTPTGDHWKDVQLSLMHSQWYRKYQPRSVAVVAMFDPEYDLGHSRQAERKVKVLEASLYRHAPVRGHAQKHATAAHSGTPARSH